MKMGANFLSEILVPLVTPCNPLFLIQGLRGFVAYLWSFVPIGFAAPFRFSCIVYVRRQRDATETEMWRCDVTTVVLLLTFITFSLNRKTQKLGYYNGN